MEDKKQNKRGGYGMTAEEMANAFAAPATKNEKESREYILSFARGNKKRV